MDHEWDVLIARAVSIARTGAVSSWVDLAHEMNIARTTLTEGVERELGKQFETFEEFAIYAKHDDSLNRTSFTTTVNEAHASTTSENIQTLDQLLAALDVDLDEWELVKWGAKKWDGYAKRERTDLTFDEGKISGTVERGGIETKDLWSVWADFIRRSPISIMPVIQPIKTEARYTSPPPPSTAGVLRTLILPDPHVGFHRSTRTAGLDPFHDRCALDVALQIGLAAGVNRVDILGDLLDLPEWSQKFLKHPQFYWSTQPSLIEAHWWLARIRQALPEATIRLHEGNHERRLPAAILSHFPAAYELRRVDTAVKWPVLSVPNLLALDTLHVDWIHDYPDDLDWLNNKVALRHGLYARQGPGSTAAKSARESETTEIFGHSHRLEWASHTRHRRGATEVIVGFSPGCLCRVDGTVPGSKSTNQWQQGCAVVDYVVDDDLFSIQPVLIQDGIAMWNGQVFRGESPIETLREDCPDWYW